MNGELSASIHPGANGHTTLYPAISTPVAMPQAFITLFFVVAADEIIQIPSKICAAYLVIFGNVRLTVAIPSDKSPVIPYRLFRYMSPDNTSNTTQ